MKAHCFAQDLAPRPSLDAVFEHDYLLYAIKGSLRLTVENQSWILPPSFAAWIPAGSSMSVDFDNPVSVCSVLTESGFCAAMPNAPVSLQLSPMAREMIRYCRRWGHGAGDSAESDVFFLALLNVCARLIETSVDVRRMSASDPKLNRVIRLTERMLEHELSLSAVAKVVGMSECTLQRGFAQELGM